MTIPRKQQICLEQTRYYHCMSRCVRRAHLCGYDKLSGQSFEHRRRWIEDRLAFLASVFAIDLIAYAIMENHYHVVIRVDQGRAAAWSDEDVLRRWGQIFKVRPGESSCASISLWRERLASMSWFMRCVNEPVARRANAEDKCSGRFWEGRFRLQALLDDAALYRCMVYVDLNPVRAGIAAVPEQSAYTSIKARLEGRDKHLLPFFDSWQSHDEPLPMTSSEYAELVDWTGRSIRADKRGCIGAHQPAVLERIRIRNKQWLREIRHYGTWYYRAVGSLEALEQFCARVNQQWMKGVSHARPKPA